MIKGKKIVVVMPAYNTARTIAKTVRAIPNNTVDEIIIVDDGSKDNSSVIAKELGLTPIRHEKNRGYGGAQKAGYKEALRIGGDIIVMLHSDFQYDPKLLPEIIGPLIDKKADVCLGSRMAIKKNALKGGMPLWRFAANWGLTLLEDLILRLGISEYHSGYRAFSRKVLLAIPFEKNSDKYIFDTEMLAELSMGRFRVTEIPIPTHYGEDSRSPNFWKSTEYGFMTLGVLLKYILHRSGLRTYPQFVINRE